MKKFLYEIDNEYAQVQGIPFMPRVLAEKQAKIMNKEERKKLGYHVKYTVSKTSIEIKDGTPHGFTSFDDYRARRFAE